MNKGLIRTAAVILSGTILAACAGCSSGKNSSSSSRNNMVSANIPEGANVAAEDMPYGASVTQLKPETDSNIQLWIEFDNRYLKREEDGTYPSVYPVNDYFEAVNEKSGELMEKAYYPASFKDILSKANADTSDAFMANYYDIFKDTIGEDFEFDYIMIDKCIVFDGSNNEYGFDVKDDELKELDPSVIDKITERYALEVDATYRNNNGDSLLFSNRSGNALTLYEYKIDGKYYIV